VPAALTAASIRCRDGVRGFPRRQAGPRRIRQVAEAGDGLLDQIADFVITTNVGLDECRFGVEAAKFGFEGFAFRVPAAGGDNARAILGEGYSGGAADAGQRAGDQHDGAAHSISS
jgi:hypothetical protein